MKRLFYGKSIYTENLRVKTKIMKIEKRTYPIPTFALVTVF